jgi:hypothetical protein
MMRRHELDPISLVFGFAFTVAGALFLAGRLDQAVRLRWLWPLLLLALGLGVLLDLNARRPKGAAEPADLADAEPVADEPAEAGWPDAGSVHAEPVEGKRPTEAEPGAAEAAGRTDELDPEGPPERDR